jgi:hypothetical protein
MKKYIALCVLCLSFALFAFADSKPIHAFNGEDWRAWTYQIRYTFLIGFFTGAYATQQGAGNMKLLTATDVDALQITLPRATTVDKVLHEIDSFYAHEDLCIPLTIAVVLRNDKDLPSWETLSHIWKGWNYDE